MSWIISRAMIKGYVNSRSSLGLAAESSEGNSLDGEPSAQSNMSPMPLLFLPSDKMMDFLRLSRFGMTFGPLTDDLGADLLTWYLAGFPARTSASRERVPESLVSEAGSGWKWRESSVKYDPAMRLWKTRQCSLFEDSEWFSETWPRWGLMRDGECWELPMSARPITEKECGLLPTPRKQMSRKPPPDRIGVDSKNYHHNLEEAIGGRPNPRFVEWMMGWPAQWTSLTALVTDKSRSALQPPGDCCETTSMSDYYPAGTGETCPWAPWNQDAPEDEEDAGCEDLDGEDEEE